MATFTVLMGHFDSCTAKKGDKFKLGESIKAKEGKTGITNGDHIHLAVAEGKVTSLDKMRLTPLNKGNPKPNKEQCYRFANDTLYKMACKITTEYLSASYKKEFGIDHPAIDLTTVKKVYNIPVYWSIQEEGTVVATGYDSAYGNYLMITYTVSDTVGTPVKKDTTKDQIEVLVSDLRCRNTASSTNSNNILGFIKKGIYNFTETKSANGYIWYKIGTNMWIAGVKDSTKVYPKNEETPSTDPKDEQIKNLEKQVFDLVEVNQNLRDEVTKLDNEIIDLKTQLTDKPDLKQFIAPKTDKYWIKLNKDDTIYY